MPSTTCRRAKSHAIPKRAIDACDLNVTRVTCIESPYALRVSTVVRVRRRSGLADHHLRPARAEHGGARDRQRHRRHDGRRASRPRPRFGRNRRPRHRGRGSARRDRSAIPGPRDDRSVGQRGHAGADQHPYSRADGVVPWPGRRPPSDGVAAKIHLPGRGQNGVAGVRADRHAARSARDDPVRYDDLRRHVLLRGGDREGDEGCWIAGGARADDHPVPRAGREDACRRPRAHRGVRSGVA